MWMWIGVSVALASEVQIVRSSPDSVLVKAESGVVHVPACRGVTWFLFNTDTGKFEATSAAACGAIAPAIQIDEKGQEFTIDVPLPALPSVGFHILRPTVVFGEKCKDQVPFSLAKCDKMRSIDGPHLVIRHQGAASVRSPVPVQ